MTTSDMISREVLIDSTIGRNTLFTFTWSQYDNAPEVLITDPLGQEYCSHSTSSTICFDANAAIDANTKIVKFSFPGNTAVRIKKNFYVWSSKPTMQLLYGKAKLVFFETRKTIRTMMHKRVYFILPKKNTEFKHYTKFNSFFSGKMKSHVNDA